jgi:lysophospholipid acyltransferase (LPLAT)-like uncharacterized protein
MKLRHPLLIRVVALFAAVILRVWLATVRIRTVSADGQSHPADPRRTRYIYAFWHETILAPLAARPPARALISQHADGELIAQVCGFMGLGVVRGSTARGGAQALMDMIRGAGEGLHLAITPDGPRGPRRELKPGLIVVASQTGDPIVPMGIGFTNALRAKSWDRFAVPLPFSTIVGVIPAPISIPSHLARGDLERYAQRVESEMLACTAAAEAWAERLRNEGRRATPPVFPVAAPLRKSA